MYNISLYIHVCILYYYISYLYYESTISFTFFPLHSLKILFIDVSFRFRISTSPTSRVSRSAMFISRKNFSIAEKSPRFPLLLSLALRHWRATLITDRGEWMGDQGRWVRGAWNEESGSMLGQHIKIMASIGADAPYIPIRGKGLRLISIASRYPSPGWKASARAHTRTRAIYARARTHTRIRWTTYGCYVRYVIFALLVQLFVHILRFFSRKINFEPMCVFCLHIIFYSLLSVSPMKHFLYFCYSRRAIL